MSRFVSSGTISSSGEATTKAASESESASKNPEWERVQKELDAERARRSEARRKAVEGEEKSLYDILQANKAAKEAAFEEQNKLRNQFKALDEDDVEFLDEVRAKKKREEEKLRKETEEGLKAFRERQKDGEDEAGAEKKGTVEEESWGVGRKRKRNKEKEGGVKGLRRKVSEGNEEGDGKKTGEEVKEEKKGVEEAKTTSKKPALGLVDYGSDDSD